MTDTERIEELERNVSALMAMLSPRAVTEEPVEYYTSKYSGEEQDAMFDWVNAQVNPTV